MWLECTCVDINKKRWDELMKGARPLNYNWLVKKIKKELPNIYRDLDLDLYNPYSNQCYKTKTHYILVHSAIEYFFNKGEDPNKDDDLDDYYPNDEDNIYYENRKIRKNKINEGMDLPSNIFSNKITPEEHEIGLALSKYSTKGISLFMGTVSTYIDYIAKILLNKFPKYDTSSISSNPYEIIDFWIEDSIKNNMLEPKWFDIVRTAGHEKSPKEFVEWFKKEILTRLKPSNQINECLECIEDCGLIQEKINELREEKVFIQNVLYQFAICKHRLQQVYKTGEDNEIYRNWSFKNGSNGIENCYTIRKEVIIKLLSIIVNNLKNNNTLNMKKVIRLTESDLHRIIENSVKKMLKEFDMNNDYQQYQLGHAAGWAQKKRNAATSDAEWNKYHNMMRTAEKHSNQTPTNGHTFPQYNVGRYNAMQGQH